MNVTVPLAVVLVLAAAFGASAVLNVVQRMFIRSVLNGCAGEGLRTGEDVEAGAPALRLDETQHGEDGSCARMDGIDCQILSSAKRAESIAEAYHLTPREGEVLALLLEGHGTARVAEKMVVSASTVKSHTYNIYGKMGVHSHQEMIDACEAVEAARALPARMGDGSESRARRGHTPFGLSRSMA